MGRVRELLAQFGARCSFVSVYVAEAHAADEWPLGTHVVVAQHTSLAERADVAHRFAAAVDWPLPLYTDAMDNELASALAAHPERFFVLEPLAAGRTVLRFVAPGRVGGYSLDDLAAFLEVEYGRSGS